MKFPKIGFRTKLDMVLIVVLLLGWAVALTPTGVPYYLTVPTGVWNIEIGKFDNGTYYMVNYTNWNVAYKSSNPTSIFESAFGNLSSAGGTIHVRMGLYTFTSNVHIKAGNSARIQIVGDGEPLDSYNPLNSGGTVLDFNGANFFSNRTGWGCYWYFENVGLVIRGAYTFPHPKPWYLPFILFNFKTVALTVQASVPSKVWNGTAWVGYSGTFITFPSTGPPGLSPLWQDVTIYDERTGGDYSTLLTLDTENGLFQNIGLVLNPTATVIYPRLFTIKSAGDSWTTFQNLDIYGHPNFMASSCKYDYQFKLEGNITLNNVELINATKIHTAHITSIVAGSMVDVVNTQLQEAGWTMVPSLAGTATFYANSLYTKTASFIVNKWGSYYRMIDGSTGLVDYQSTNAAKTINFAIGNTTVGGTDFIEAGTYNLSTPIIGQGGVTLEGEGGAMRWPPDQFNGTVLNLNGAIYGIHTLASAISYANFKVRDLTINLNNTANSVGIFLESMINFEVSKVVVAYGDVTNSTGIWIGGVTGQNAANGLVTGCTISNVTIGIEQTGIPVTSDESRFTDNFIENTYSRAMQLCGGLDIIANNDFLYGNYGVEILNSKRNTITSNVFDDFSGYPIVIGYSSPAGDANSVIGNQIVQSTTSAAKAISISSSGNEIIGNTITVMTPYRYTGYVIDINGGDNNTIADNHVENIGSWGCVIESGSNNIVINNDFSGVTGTKLSNYGGTNSKISGNIGFATENSGMVVNATATTFTISHGLVGTPTWIGCSFNSTNIESWKWTSTSSTITITVYNRVTTDVKVACYWSAVYKP